MPPHISSPKLGQPQRTASHDSTADGIRKRVCKACDRCRMKKSKCDGSSPCTRCRADNAICVFGERKKSHDKVYPKGYVEVLEQQQNQLVSGLQELYKRLQAAQAWDGTTLTESNGHPLTHDILAALNLLDSKQDGIDTEAFEEDVQKIQARLLAEGAGFAHRRGSISSESDHSLPGHARSISLDTPALSRPNMFHDSSFQFSAPPSPFPQSPAVMAQHHQRPSFPMSHSSHTSHRSPLSGDPQFYQAEWAFPESDPTDKLMRARYAAMHEQSLSLAGGMAELEQQNWDQSTMPVYNMGVPSLSQTWPAQQLMTAACATLPRNGDQRAETDQQMDIDLNQYIQMVN